MRSLRFFKFKFIVLISASAAVATTDIRPSYTTSRNGYLYSYFNTLLNFEDAEANCHSHNFSDLATVKNEADQKWLQSEAVQARPYKDEVEYWIGLRNETFKVNESYSFTGFGWIADGSVPNYTNWFSGDKWFPKQPEAGNGRCAYMLSLPDNYVLDGNWFNDVCRKEFCSICQRKLPVKFTLGEYTYFIHERKAATVDEAEDICTHADGDGHLVDIKTAAVQASIVKRLPLGDFFCIGAKANEYGEYRWTDGSELNYTNWDFEQPYFQDGQCDVIDASSIPVNGKWISWNCSTPCIPVCQKAIDKCANSSLHSCHHDAICSMGKDANYNCTCREGFYGDGHRMCTPIVHLYEWVPPLAATVFAFVIAGVAFLIWRRRKRTLVESVGTADEESEEATARTPLLQPPVIKKIYQGPVYHIEPGAVTGNRPVIGVQAGSFIQRFDEAIDDEGAENEPE